MTGKSYVGYTSTTLEKRFDNHKAQARRGSSLHFHRAIRKCGEDCWVSEILAECESLCKAHKLETEMIATHNTLTDGYNMTMGGEGTKGRFVSEEAKRRSSEWHSRFTHTNETKQLMKNKFTKLRGKSVAQYDLNGKFIASFPSATLAAEHLGNKNLRGSIQQMCAGKLS